MKNVACMGDTRSEYRVWVGDTLKGRECLEDLGLGRRLILKFLVKEVRWEGLNVTCWAHERGLCRAAGNSVLSSRVAYLWGIS